MQNPSSQDNLKKLTVIGGGITGLATAYLAAKAGAEVTLIEKSVHFGGLLRTFETGGEKLEFYYHHFFNHDAEINWLIRQLDIAHKLLYKQSTMGVFRDGKIYDFNSAMDLLAFRPMNFLDKIRFGLTSLFLGKVADWRNYEGVPARNWLEKWAGKSAASSLWNPMLNIKFGPYTDEVPLSWMVGRLKQRLGSRNSGGKEELGYLDGSLDVLLQALLDSLQKMGVNLMPGNALTALHVENGELKGISTEKARIEGGNFVFSLPGTHLIRFLPDNTPKLKKDLSAIKYFGALCLVLETSRPLSEIYWMNVADPGFPFGGVIEHTNFISPAHYAGKHITYLSRYFAHDDPLASMDQKEVEALMLPALKRIFPELQPDWIRDIQMFRTMTAATVCDLDFSKRVPPCKTEIKHLFLANMAHIYPDERSTNNSIRVAAETCKVLGLGAEAEKIPYGSSLSGKIGFDDT
ncbi:MAG: NAD(P)/FAD-dependent oxidoreductase [Bacteroidia bacterium]|nr:NAD(P)/FAD-dependent oxidoreductase [Bacteroidia bacterium]